MDILMDIMASGFARERGGTTTRTKVTQQGGRTPANRLIETCSLGLQHKSLILDMHVMVDWPMLKQGIRRPVSRDYIAGSSFKLIEVRCFFS